MDLHISAVKYIKSCFTVCEHVANQEMVLVGAVKH